MTDFFREVDEEVRRDRAVKLLQRFQIPLIGLAVLVVAATAAWRIYDTWSTNQAQEAGAAYEAADQLARDNKSAEAEAAFQKIVESSPKGYALLARFRVAATTAATDPDAAVKDYDALARDATVDPTLRDIARYRAALLRLDKADSKEMDERLAPLTRTTNPFRNSARELLALAALKANDYAAAGNWLDMIVADPQTPDDLRQRAETYLGIVAANQTAPNQPAPSQSAPSQSAPDQPAANQSAPK